MGNTTKRKKLLGEKGQRDLKKRVKRGNPKCRCTKEFIQNSWNYLLMRGEEDLSQGNVPREGGGNHMCGEIRHPPLKKKSTVSVYRFHGEGYQRNSCKDKGVGEKRSSKGRGRLLTAKDK